MTIDALTAPTVTDVEFYYLDCIESGVGLGIAEADLQRMESKGLITLDAADKPELTEYGQSILDLGI